MASESAPAMAVVAPASDVSPAELEVSFVLDMDAEAAAQAVENLVAELGRRWPVTTISRPNSVDAPWSLRLGAGADADIVRGLLDFVARSDSIRVGSVGSLARVTDDSAGAYGFFDDVPAPAKADADDSWGLFSDAAGPGTEVAQAVVPAVVPAAEDAYGFFVDPPAPAAADARSPAPTLAAVAGSEGDGFGFFVDVPAPVAAAPDSATPVAAAVNPEVVALSAKAGAAKRSAPKPPAGAESSIRVDVDKVDQLINLIGELVITQAMLAQSASALDPVQFERLHNGLAQLERNTRDMQESVMSIRMMPISVVFSRFPRVVRDLAQKLGKQIELKTIGEGTELDKSLIERIKIGRASCRERV